MLAINNARKPPQKVTPNLLPAQLHHNGPINATDRYWNPSKLDDTKSEAYLRGRHLLGTTLPLPSNYTGAVLHITDKALPQAQPQEQSNNDRMDEDDNDESDKVEVKVAEKVGEFDEVMVWGHDAVVDAQLDPYARGIGEWIGFAEAMHVEPGGTEDKKQDAKTS